MHDPLAAWLRPGPAAPPEAVAAALARALLPPVAEDAPPGWLRSDQQLSFGRALSAVRRHGGALLADGVGTGKTWIGLAVAGAVDPGRPIHVLVPAALMPQWREAGRRIGCEVLIHSHETLSRGRAPRSGPGPVVIDESHRFRTPTTRRYETLAPWCVGRRGLLLSATPAVNHLEDVVHQLRLFVRDDALAWSGVASLLARAREGAGGPFARLVVTGEDRSAQLPVRVEQDIAPREWAGSPFERLRRGTIALRLAGDPSVAGLLRMSLFLALASSPAALAAALSRYAGLLRHAEDALASGRTISREVIRRMAGRDRDQLVLWPLVTDAGSDPDLATEDLAQVRELTIAARAWSAAPDAKVRALAEILRRHRPTLVFTSAVATVGHIRRHLGGRGIAWCTGRSAGLDGMEVPRESVLDWFRRTPPPEPDRARPPSLLIATDVAAEGLDLPLVERVVHYDLPWTQVRLEQRSGRAVRLGARHEQVEVIRFRPPEELEEALRRDAILERKSGLPSALGLDHGADAPWRTSARIAARWAGRRAIEGVAVVPGSLAGVLAGFRIRPSGERPRDIVLARIGRRWSDDPGLTARLLSAAEGHSLVRPPDPTLLRGVLRGLSAQVRSALRLAHGARIAAGARPPMHRLALRRMLGLAREAARSRDRECLALLERGIRFLRRGHTAGESRSTLGWADLPEEALFQALMRLPREATEPAPEGVEIIGILVVEAVPRCR